LRFDWKYARPRGLRDDEQFTGNSGCFLHIQGRPGITPRCVEVQGYYREHGKIFAINGAKGSFRFDAATLKEVRKPVGEWNTTEIVCQGNRITSKVNGAVIG